MGERPSKKREPSDYVWSLRVEEAGDREAKVYARKHFFSVGRQASLADDEDHPIAVEYPLGTLGGDIVSGFRSQAARQDVLVDGLELVVSGRLGKPLVSLGVVGAEGKPGFESISAILYVSSDAEEAPSRESGERVWKSHPLSGPSRDVWPFRSTSL